MNKDVSPNYEELVQSLLMAEEDYFKKNAYSDHVLQSWMACRFYVLNEVLQKSLSFSRLHRIDNSTIIARMLGAASSLAAFPLKIFARRGGIVLLLHERSSNLRDPYLEAVETWASSEASILSKTYLGDSRSLSLRHCFSKSVISIEAFKGLSKLFSKLLSRVYTPSWQNKLFKEALSSHNVGRAPRILSQRHIENILLGRFYQALFFVIKPKIVFLSVSYTNIALIQAARSQGCLVVECQHGLVSNLHVGYASRLHCPETSVDYFGKFGPGWITPSIATQGFILGVGPRMLPATAPPLRIFADGMILVISQKSINAKIARAIPIIQKAYPRCTVSIKLHPAEFSDHPYNDLSVEILKVGRILDLAFNAEFVVGVYSTAMFEIVQAGISVNILPIEGSEMIPKDVPRFNFVNGENPELCTAKSRVVEEVTYFEPPPLHGLREIANKHLIS